MSTKTVRMDPEDEQILEGIRKRTGWTASDAIKRGLRALAKELSSSRSGRAFEIYESLDLGPGGYAAGPARQSRETAREVIARKHRR